jgi:hypothetical protein
MEVVPRNTSYPVTATLSVEAIQLSVSDVAARLAEVRPVGTLGAEVSVSRELWAGPVPEGVKVELVVRMILSTTTQSSRIQMLTVA